MDVVLIRAKDPFKGATELLDIIRPSPPAGKRIFIKPNIVVAAKRSSAAITHPELVRGVVRWFKARGFGEITIGESPALTTEAGSCFGLSGYRKMAEEEGVELLDLNKARRVVVAWKFGKLALPEIAFDSYYINIAKLKTHVQTLVTLGLKNQKGLLENKDKKEFHRLGLHEPIAHLLGAVKPDLTIIDGVVGMQGDGPLDGGRVKSGVVVGGTDSVKVDMVGCMAMGFDPREVEHLAPLIGSLDFEFRGKELLGALRPFERPDRVSKKLLKLTSWRSTTACTMCTYNMSLALPRLIKDPRNYGKLLKVLYWTVFRGFNLIFGRPANLPNLKGKVVLIGNCARVPYEGLDVTRIKGCPPGVDDIIDSL